MENVVEVENVYKAFGKGKSRVVALDNVSFSIGKGEIFGLLGPNGAGKTTIISILTSLLEKDSGKISILNLDLDSELETIRPRVNLMLGFTGIGMSLTVREFLKYYCLLYNLDKIEQRVEKAILAMDMQDKADHLTIDLSSGYKQRAMFAKALLNDPEIIFLDEPTVGLDVDIAIKMRALIKNLKKQGKTILLTTHNMFEVEELCDKIALISHGKIIAKGTVEEIKKMIKVDKLIEVEVDDLRGFAAEMKKQPFVISSVVFEDVVHVKVESYKFVKKVMGYLSKSKHIVYSVRLVEPTLEEAFLKIMDGQKKKKTEKSKSRRGKK